MAKTKRRIKKITDSDFEAFKPEVTVDGKKFLIVPPGFFSGNEAAEKDMVLKTDDEFLKKEEATYYYHSRFVAAIAAFIPEVVDYLREEVYPEYKPLADLDMAKYEKKYGELAYTEFHIRESASKKYLDRALRVCADKYHISNAGHNFLVHFVRAGSHNLRDWYLMARNERSGFGVFRVKGLTALSPARWEGEPPPSDLETFTLEIDFTCCAHFREQQLFAAATEGFIRKLTEWLAARERSGYFEAMKSKKKRPDGRWKAFKYLAHYMVLKKPAKQIAEEFGTSKRRVEEAINTACEILEFNRKALEHRRGRPRKLRDFRHPESVT